MPRCRSVTGSTSVVPFDGSRTPCLLAENRGERVVEQLFNGDVKAEPGRSNPTMWPLADTGPYYAALLDRLVKEDVLPRRAVIR